MGLYGTIVSSAGIPQQGVTVSLYDEKDSSYSTVLADTITDDSGRYIFPNLPSGTYNIEAIKKSDTSEFKFIVTDIQFDSVTAIESGYHVGRDTLLLPGIISGSVSLGKADNSGVLIYIPGTSYHAYSNSDGQFEITNIAQQENYQLHFSANGYSDSTLYGITIVSDSTTTITAVELSIDPESIPDAPTLDTPLFNPNDRKVILSWNEVNHPNLAGYKLYRKDSTLTGAEPTDLTSETVIAGNRVSLVDTLTFLNPGDTITLQYQMKSQHTKGDQSAFSWPVYVTVYREKQETANWYWRTEYSSGLPLYYITNHDNSAWRSESYGVSGTWSDSTGELRVAWSDLWKDEIVDNNDGTFTKNAYNSSTPFDASPTNSVPAKPLLIPTPVSYWPMNPSASDAIGANSGTIMGTSTTKGRDGNSIGALAFDKQSIVKIPEDSSLAFTGSFSMSLWYNKDSYDPSDRDFLVFRGTPGSGLDAYFLALEKDSTWVFHIENENRVSNKLIIPIEDTHFGSWKHIAAVFNAETKTMAVYMDGVEIGSQATTITPYGPTPGTEQFIRIGGYKATSSFGIDGETGLWLGGIDDVMMFDTALTPSQVSELAQF